MVGEDAGRPTPTARVLALDGIRGLAALYVVMHHCWLVTFHGYPANSGPPWLGWLVYGHLAVVMFIVLSGFSLALAPARHSWNLGGLARFARRRARRILPAYWAALTCSLVVAWAVTPELHSGPPNGRSVLVYSLLLQDMFKAPVPNIAFWSIAVEAELYLIFPLLILMRRRVGALVTLFAVALPVIAVGLLRPSMATADELTGMAPQFAPLFAVGVVAAGVVVARGRLRRVRWAWFAVGAGAPTVLLMITHGSVWTGDHYYWIDLAICPAMALLLAALAAGQADLVARLLTTRPMRALGRCSYSLYLIHFPIVLVVSRKLAGAYFAPGLPTFWVTLVVGVSLSVVTATLFARVFEAPFVQHRAPASRGVPTPSAAGPIVTHQRIRTLSVT
jgi:peptidoglycan/LPS O-acetylase OafA/YrhL